MLREYLIVLAKKWIIWLFLALDFIGIVILVFNILEPNRALPAWLLWVVFGIALFCFALANFLIFSDQEEEKRLLRSRIDELEAVEAKLKLRELRSGFSPGHGGRSPAFLKVKIDQYGYDSNGVPGWAGVWIEIEVENVGYKPGVLIMDLDRENSLLPPIFGLNQAEASISYGPFPTEFDPQSRQKAKVDLDFLVIERDPLVFAEALRQLSNYKLVLSYSTQRIGSVSDETKLVVKGNFNQFREEISKHWGGFGYQNLAQIATND